MTPRRRRVVVALGQLLAVVALLFAGFTLPAEAAGVGHTYDAAYFVYDASLDVAPGPIVESRGLGSPVDQAGSAVTADVGTSGYVDGRSLDLVAPSGALDDLVRLGDDIAPSDWVRRTADNGKGTVWQRPGATGNADMLRVMEPTDLYPNGYARFYNEHGQPLNLTGKPGPQSETHIPLQTDGSLQIPDGWP